MGRDHTQRAMVVVVTTARRPTPELRSGAEELATELGLEVVERAGQSISALRQRHGADGVLVVAHDGITYRVGDVTFFYHPSMAKVRVRGLQLGARDVTVDAMGLQPGWQVLDCTLGRASDAAVAAHVVGTSGRVVGLEIDPIIAALTRRGLLTFDPDSRALSEALRRIDVICADHADYLAQASSRSFDVVYFDPFFEETVEASGAMQDLRAVGSHGAVTADSLAEAARVARRRVVFKTRRGLCPPLVAAWRAVAGGKSRVEYRVLDIEES